MAKKLKSVETILQKRKQRTYDHMMQQLAEGDLLPAEMAKLSDHFGKKMHGGIDIGYLKTVLFPEQYSYDIPFPLTSVSFCKFTDKQEMVISTGADGSGSIIWYPRTTCGPQLFVGKVAPTAEGKALTPTDFTAGPFVKSYQYFTQAALVSAALTLQYVGKVENESGLMVGGHLYGLSPDVITTDEIENSQWVTRCRPGEGLRFVHLPRDGTDFEFYQTPCGTAPLAASADYAAFFSTNEGANKVSNATTVLTPSAWKTPKVGGTEPLAIPPNFATEFYGTTKTGSILYRRQANCIAIYWSGMEANQNWLRVDVARKFDGIPLSQYRDIMELTRPVKQFDEKKTFNVLNALCQSAPVGGHTLKEVDRIVDRLAQALPNVSYLMENGGIRSVSTLGELADVLEHPLEEEKGLAGAPTGEIGRIYHYF